ncbi:unnamed protein product [Adineta ricciae]|uniref:MIT domain-containing protein n=1 Tax=Adineta ricciae TaxID=249248 RepID=A0A814V3P6_ADIRI|nr:unnamed protein product [Adineta ricciae]
MSGTQRSVYFGEEHARNGSLLRGILDEQCVVWLGSQANHTIPTFTHKLRDTIVFLDTSIDCTNHITSSESSVVLIISDEYAIHQKTIEDMLSVVQVKMIYVVIDESQLSSSSSTQLLSNQRIEYIFDDASTINQCWHQVRNWVLNRINRPNGHQPAEIRIDRNYYIWKAIQHAERAVTEDQNENYLVAERSYRTAVRWLAHSLKYITLTDQMKQQVQEKLDSYASRADTIRSSYNEESVDIIVQDCDSLTNENNKEISAS